MSPEERDRALIYDMIEAAPRRGSELINALPGVRYNNLLILRAFESIGHSTKHPPHPEERRLRRVSKDGQKTPRLLHILRDTRFARYKDEGVVVVGAEKKVDKFTTSEWRAPSNMRLISKLETLMAAK